MPLDFSNTRILVVSRTPQDSQYMQDFFERTPIARPDFVVGEFRASDKYDLIVFDAAGIGPVMKISDFVDLPDAITAHYRLLDRYISDTNKYILYFGKMYFNLNQERCPSANSKFTLYARIRELIDFINHYRPA